MKIFGLKKPLPLWNKTVRIDYVPGTYVKEFDGWRGVAIIFVVLAHYFAVYFSASWVFMEMFFVMSGFLITGILLDSKHKKDYYKGFILRRVLRVFPLYYICLAILFFLIPASWMSIAYYREHQIWFWTYMENWLYSVDGWPDNKGLHHFWSLAIEEQFYIVWPLVVYLFSTRGLVRFCIFLFFFSLVFRNIGLHIGFVTPFPYVATLGRMEGIVLGAIIAVLMRTDKSFLEKYTFPTTVISGILMVAAFIVAGGTRMDNPVHYIINYTIVDIFFAGMIVLTMCGGELVYFKKILNAPLFRQLGVMSYCIYIFHYPIKVMVSENFQDYFQGVSHSEGIAKLICVIISFLITVPVVYVLHKWVEMPFWKLKRYVK